MFFTTALSKRDCSRKNTAAVQQWGQWWHDSIVLFDFLPPIRKAIHPFNSIEFMNNVIRNFTLNRKQYLNAELALKLVYLAIREASKN